MTAAEARTHIRYSGWASRKVLDAALTLPAEDQFKPMGVSHESVLGTLRHIYWADRIWYKRTVEPDLEMPVTVSERPSVEVLTGDWQDLQKRWEAWADSLTDSDVSRIVSFKMSNGTPAEASAIHIVLHLVNHATLHRGQVVGMLRQLGVKPPGTDFFFYLRELATTAAAS
jgi:uncharacterized damage-inducible protein DinB